MTKTSTQAMKFVPSMKPLSEHKRPMTFSLDPSNREWIRENYLKLGYRNESHMVEEAIKQLKEKMEKKNDSEVQRP